MGVNYYMYKECELCGGSEGEKIHIGKSSAGWYFSLRIYPERNINNLADWVDMFEKDGVVIKDEYGRKISPLQMVLQITDRLVNRCERHEVNGLCVGHGRGTYDYFMGDFS